MSMPIHVYRCQDCGTTSEFLVGVSAELAGQVILCTSCQGARMTKLLASFSLGRGSHSAPACGPGGDCGVPGSGMGGCCGGACHGHG